ncbi:TlpA family protein disulfide reductase [bacterium]|nr:TlpA family protein disulfide reductase [bacterium]
MRPALVTALVVACGLFAAGGGAQDGPADPARVAKSKAIQKTFSDEFDGLLKKFQQATTPAEKNGVKTEAKELAALTAEKVVAFVAENPKDAAAFDLARFGLTKLPSFGVTGAPIEKLAAAVADHHLGHPDLGDVVIVAGRLGAPGEKILRAAEKSPDKKTRGTALLLLGTNLAEQANDAPTLKGGVEMTDRAVQYLEKAAKEAGDVRVGPATIEKMAAEQLEMIKTLGIGRPAPEITGVGLKDEKTTLSSLKGKVVLLDIWATWCPPCRAMIPHERELVKRMEKKPFVLVSVSADEKRETLTEFIGREPMPWTHWWNGKDGPILEAYRVEAFPTLYLIDARGTIRKKWVGAPENEALDKAVEELVREAEAVTN